MNYLAHILLSGNDPMVQIGNFIGDAVKGSAYKDYPERVGRGVLLHRAIDSYTDSHPDIKELVRSLRPRFGRYSAVVLDIYFDYLLASRFSDFSGVPLKKYTRRFYISMTFRRRYLPTRIKRFMWHFIWTDRLGKYSTPSGIRSSLEIMVSVHRLDIDVDEAVEYMVKNQEELYRAFKPFFSDLQSLCCSYIEAEVPPGSL